MKHGREAVDAFATDVLHLILRLRPVLEGSPTTWPDGRGPRAAAIARDLSTAVEALDSAVERLYLQAESLEMAHQALEIERRAYQELFEGGPDGYLVTDPEGMILRANRRAGELFACATDDLVGELLPALVEEQHRPSLEAAIAAFELRDWDGEWIGQGVSAAGMPFSLALTAAVVRHGDGSVYRVRWSLRDVSNRPTTD
ncbi:MAG TPA: PAS domain-containing protein [Gemmatimonadales bacterium]